MEFKLFFFVSMALVSASSSAFCWSISSCFNTWHILWHVANYSHNALGSNITSLNWTYIKPISLPRTLKKCFAILAFFVGVNLLAPFANPLTFCGVKWHLWFHLNHNIQLFSIHGLIHVWCQLKGSLFTRALNNLIIDPKKWILGVKVAIGCCWLGYNYYWWYWLKSDKGNCWRNLGLCFMNQGNYCRSWGLSRGVEGFTFITNMLRMYIGPS